MSADQWLGVGGLIMCGSAIVALIGSLIVGWKYGWDD